jgi:hypothetical protein
MGAEEVGSSKQAKNHNVHCAVIAIQQGPCPLTSPVNPSTPKTNRIFGDIANDANLQSIFILDTFKVKVKVKSQKVKVKVKVPIPPYRG